MITIYSVNDSGAGGEAIIEIQTHSTKGLPVIQIIGAVGKSLDESKERISSALKSSQISLPNRKRTINLAPSDIPKNGSHFDLAIAVSILVDSNQIKPPTKNTIILGEIGLDGSVHPIRGLLGKILIAKKAGFTNFIIPKGNQRQGFLVPNINISTAESLKKIYNLLSTGNMEYINTKNGSKINSSNSKHKIDFAEVIGQKLAKRALEIAAAGQHNILLSGPPGVGKSMLAKAMISIMPPLQREEIITITHLHSLVNANSGALITERPVRAPHHSASNVAIIGGGQKALPGEVTLSHTGILFLDELPEFSRSTIESLRQPLEEKQVSIARAKQSAVYPADFILVATKNPCPCGFWGSNKPCICSPIEIDRYQKKLSGPLIDRIDLHVTVDSIDHRSLLKDRVNLQTENSSSIRERVLRTLSTQKNRFGKHSLMRNGTMHNKEVKKFANLTKEAKLFLDNAAEKLDISARVYMKTVKVARTIADLDGSDTIEIQHITEALQYRPSTTA